jgi:hypothetical protein
MIDWFVVLTPLMLLPIVLIFGFVGCILNRYGTRYIPIFQFQGGLGSPSGPLVSLRVTLTLTVDSFSKTAAPPMLTAIGGDFPKKAPPGQPEQMGTISFPSLQAGVEDAVFNTGEIGAAIDVTLACFVTIVGDTEFEVPVNQHPNLETDGYKGQWNDFLLVVSGTGFQRSDYTVT